MVLEVRGNFIRFTSEANEFTSMRVPVTLPDGYSYETIHILYAHNVSEIAYHVHISNGMTCHFPPVRSHSPSAFALLLNDTAEKAEIRILIEKFGQIPDANYFNKEFEPILVTGDDGNTYNVIPSDQFK